MPLISEDYYSVAEFAANHRAHAKTVYRWIRQGIAPAHELFGRMYWFEKKAADAWSRPKLGRKKVARANNM